MISYDRNFLLRLGSLIYDLKNWIQVLFKL